MNHVVTNTSANTFGRPPDVSRSDPVGPSPIVVVRCIEARLHETVGLAVTAARLYGVEVVDAAAFRDPHGCAARVSFVDEHVDASELVFGSAAHCVHRFDGLVLASTRWHPIDRGRGARPGEHERRRRARVTVFVGPAGAATAIRLEHQPEDVHVVPGLAWGGATGLRLAAVWASTSPPSTRSRPG